MGFDRRWLRVAFDRAAPHYDAAAALQRTVADSLLQRLDFIRLSPHRVVDVGAGTGYCSSALARRYPRARVVALDISPAMLAHARLRAPRLFSRQHFLCSDAAAMALRRDACDLVFSSLTLQWCEDLDRTLAELWRVCAPGGLLHFSTLGPDTLRELRDSWTRAEGHGATHVNAFLDMHVVGDRLVRAGFSDVVMDVDRAQRRYPDVTALMRELKAVGAHNVNATRARQLTGPGVLAGVRQAYETYRQDDGMLPATYEVVYGHAWKPEAPGNLAVRWHPPPPSAGHFASGQTDLAP